jgi:hypothetical protein
MGKPGESNAGILRRRTLLISAGGWLAEIPMSSTADGPTKLLGLFSAAECEGRNCGTAATTGVEGVESARSTDRLYRSGATLGVAAVAVGCGDVPLPAWEGRGAGAALLVPGTGSAESSRVARPMWPICRLRFAVLGRLVIETLAAA